MADWTDIPASTFDTGKPVKGSTHENINQNIEAIAQGATGAPKYGTGNILMVLKVDDSPLPNSIDSFVCHSSVDGYEYTASTNNLRVLLTANVDWSSASEVVITSSLISDGAAPDEVLPLRTVNNGTNIEIFASTPAATNYIIHINVSYLRSGTLPV